MKGHIRERSPCHWAIVMDVRNAEADSKGTKRGARLATVPAVESA